MYSSILRWSVSKPSAMQCFCQANHLARHQMKIIVSKRYLYSERLCSLNSLNTKSTLLFPSRMSQLNLENSVMRIHSSSCKTNQETPQVETLSKKDRLKRAFKDYGATIIIFHVTISLMSLGISYLIVSSGVDVPSLLEKVGINGSGLATGASTFVVAYAFHKLFAPVRMSITLGATPFIVRYLRRIGFLKPPKPTSS